MKNAMMQMFKRFNSYPLRWLNATELSSCEILRVGFMACGEKTTGGRGVLEDLVPCSSLCSSSSVPFTFF